MESKIDRILNIGVPIAILAFFIIGARTEIQAVQYLAIGVSLVAIICATFGILGFQKNGLLLYCIALGLLFQTTLVSNYLVGTDIHGEYYFAWKSLVEGWDYKIPLEYNTSLINLIFPVFSIFKEEYLVWVFKTVPAVMLALVPVIAYYILKQYFREVVAFLSGIFIIAIPSYLSEVVGIAKESIGEVFLIGVLWVILNKGSRKRTRIILLPILIILTFLTHYTCGIVLAILLGGMLIVLLVRKSLKRKTFKSLLPLKWLVPCIAGGILISGLYLGVVGEGRVLKAYYNQVAGITNLGARYLSLDINLKYIDVVPLQQFEFVEQPSFENPSLEIPGVDNPVLPKAGYLQSLGPTLIAALGFDFLEVPFWAKVFRILQYLTQILLIIGVVWFLIKGRKKFANPEEYLGLVVAGTVLMGLVVLLPGFANTINASRFYHLISLVLAPLLVLGGLLLLKKPWAVVLLLVVYMIFTTGLVFELTKQKDNKGFYIPYSNGLSGYRVDSTGIYSSSDEEVRKYILKEGITKISADQWGTTFLIEKLSFLPDYFPYNTKYIPAENYIFLRERNEEKQEITYWWGIGTRISHGYDKINMTTEVLKDREIVYESGKAKLYSPRDTNDK